MPRRPRIILPNIPLHIIQRGNNRQACFATDVDYHNYLNWLKDYAGNTGCHVHAYVLMTNHVHLLLTADEKESTGKLMKALGQRYVQYFNRSYQRSGTLWEGRFRSCLIQVERYLLSCMRYIELNPVRAEMVSHPSEYPWSSYRANALGEQSVLVEPHALFHQLAKDKFGRHLAYQDLFSTALEPSLINDIRHSTNGNVVLGNEHFSAEISKILGNRVTHKSAGRPKKTLETK